MIKVQTITYQQAVDRMNKLFDAQLRGPMCSLDVFGASTILAYLFEKSKEDTLDDLVEARR